LYIVNLAIEEPLGIIISYGRKSDLPLTIQIEVKIHPKSISILIVDNGRTFNPLSVPHLDIRKTTIDRPAKELSMHLVRNIMESMWYERKDGKNIFQIQLER
jgi:sigma-B regulation protein RsbU (phosphoserine phosphatase)